ncbi:hypothetical protein GF371_02265 [Candidatus Woesearchaeota archaeon]|nr:hypothetical protein [Candidatus Woesearchaeota archaeon]
MVTLVVPDVTTLSKDISVFTVEKSTSTSEPVGVGWVSVSVPGRVTDMDIETDSTALPVMPLVLENKAIKAHDKKKIMNSMHEIKLDADKEYKAEAILRYAGMESEQVITQKFIAKESRRKTNLKTSADSQKKSVTKKTNTYQTPAQNQIIQQYPQSTKDGSFYFYAFIFAGAIAVGAIFFILGMFVGKHYFLME